MTFKKILCPTDFSSGSRQALRVAARLACESGAELELVHVWYLPTPAFAIDYAFPADVIQRASDDAERALADALREAKALGVEHVTAKQLDGPPWSAIVDAAEGFDLIVIGTHGRTGLARVLLGSVAEKVIRHAACSVLAVRPDGEPRPFDHVLCPVDFTTSSHQAMQMAGRLVRSGGTGVTLLHVLEIPVASSGDPGLDVYQDLDRRSAAQLDHWATELERECNVAVSKRARIGYAGAETLAVLDGDRTFDLVVMGSHGRTGIRRALLGSVAEKVVRNARCPVLVVRGR